MNSIGVVREEVKRPLADIINLSTYQKSFYTLFLRFTFLKAYFKRRSSHSGLYGNNNN